MSRYRLHITNPEYQFSQSYEDLEREERRRAYEEDNQEFNNTEQPTNFPTESDLPPHAD
jgi:hypothetical protein